MRNIYLTQRPRTHELPLSGLEPERRYNRHRSPNAACLPIPPQGRNYASRPACFLSTRKSMSAVLLARSWLNVTRQTSMFFCWSGKSDVKTIVIIPSARVNAFTLSTQTGAVVSGTVSRVSSFTDSDLDDFFRVCFFFVDRFFFAMCPVQ